MHSPLHEAFTNKVEYVIFKKQNIITPNTLYLYRILKLYGFVKGGFRQSLLNRIITTL